MVDALVTGRCTLGQKEGTWQHFGFGTVCVVIFKSCVFCHMFLCVSFISVAPMGVRRYVRSVLGSVLGTSLIPIDVAQNRWRTCSYFQGSSVPQTT